MKAQSKNIPRNQKCGRNHHGRTQLHPPILHEKITQWLLLVVVVPSLTLQSLMIMPWTSLCFPKTTTTTSRRMQVQGTTRRHHHHGCFDASSDPPLCWDFWWVSWFKRCFPDKWEDVYFTARFAEDTQLGEFFLFLICRETTASQKSTACVSQEICRLFSKFWIVGRLWRWQEAPFWAPAFLFA